MNDTQRQQIKEFRGKGYGYGRIAQMLSLSENTIKTYCRRHGLGGVVATPAPIDGEVHHCLCCGKEVVSGFSRSRASVTFSLISSVKVTFPDSKRLIYSRLTPAMTANWFCETPYCVRCFFSSFIQSVSFSENPSNQKGM